MKRRTRPRDSSARMEELRGGLRRALMVFKESGAVVCPIQNGLWHAVSPPRGNVELWDGQVSCCLVKSRNDPGSLTFSGNPCFLYLLH